MCGLRDNHWLLVKKVPYQLELPFGPKLDSCPECNPPADPQQGLFASMCERHWRETENSFDREAFEEAFKKSIEQGQRDAEAYRQYLPTRPGYFRG